LGVVLISSVRRRRRELALLKTLGLIRSQLAAVVSWQASATAVVGAMVGVPLGVVLGRVLWTFFARDIGAVPQATVPVLQVVLVGLVTVALANLVALGPARLAARTPAATVLVRD
jgi:ABC-type lipoprotein release transport system permease subunit